MNHLIVTTWVKVFAKVLLEFYRETLENCFGFAKNLAAREAAAREDIENVRALLFSFDSNHAPSLFETNV